MIRNGAPGAWSLVESGELGSFSIGADPASLRLQGTADGVRFIDSWTLQEISLCERPANPDCLDAVEILGGTRIHRKLLVPKAAEQVATEPRLVEVSTHTPIRDPETGRISSSISVKRIGNGDLVELTTSTPVWDDAVGKGQRIKTIIVVKEVVAATEELGQLRDYAANLEARPRKVL